jgi:hypothetical protein
VLVKQGEQHTVFLSALNSTATCIRRMLLHAAKICMMYYLCTSLQTSSPACPTLAGTTTVITTSPMGVRLDQLSSGLGRHFHVEMASSILHVLAGKLTSVYWRLDKRL